MRSSLMEDQQSGLPSRCWWERVVCEPRRDGAPNEGATVAFSVVRRNPFCTCASAAFSSCHGSVARNRLEGPISFSGPSVGATKTTFLPLSPTVDGIDLK